MKPSADTRKPYSGAARSLVIALDVGTTFSGVSYAILDPGEVPKIHGVTRFPGQEHVAGDSKIPSIMYYDTQGYVVAAGAEAEGASMVSQAEDFGWTKAELFKLRMRPKTMKLNMNGMRLSPLPRHKTPVHVFGDFLHYLFECTRNFFIDTHANGHSLWQAVEHDIQFVLSHPNGWEGAQQSKMRRAAIHGGLIPDTDEGKARIRFVTEGEASLHACVQSGLAADVLSNPSRHGFVVADAGGGTLDISSYAIRGNSPLVIEEIAPPDCVFAGSVFVSRRARAFLEEKLKNSKYGTADALDHITKRFDETTKRLFRDRKDMQFISFGSPLDKDPAVGIRGGQLKLAGTEVAELFEPSIDAAVASIKSQIEASGGTIKSVWLVGGFAASQWLFSQLQERLAPMRITVSRPDKQTSKAVADGAIGFYCDHHVSARISKFMYGVEFLREYDQNDEEHVARQSRLCELPSGPKLLPDAFDCILSRSIRVKESTVFTRKYCTELTSLSMLSVFEVEIWCYRGGNTIPKWILRHAEDFSTLCVVRADLSPLSGSAQPKKGRNGKTYWTIVFSVEIHFGLTEFKARIKWVDNGSTKYGPASIVYNESGHRADEDETDSSLDDDGTVTSSRGVSEPASRARSRDSLSYGSRPTSTVDLSREISSSHLDPREQETLRGSDRDRRSSRAHSSTSYASSPMDEKYSERDATIRARDKGKDRDRSSRIYDRPHTDAHSERPAPSQRGSVLGDTLSSVWGAVSSTVYPSGAPPPPSAPTHTSRSIDSASVRSRSTARPSHERERIREIPPEPAQPPALPPMIESSLSQPTLQASQPRTPTSARTPKTSTSSKVPGGWSMSGTAHVGAAERNSEELSSSARRLKEEAERKQALEKEREREEQAWKQKIEQESQEKEAAEREENARREAEEAERVRREIAEREEAEKIQRKAEEKERKERERKEKEERERKEAEEKTEQARKEAEKKEKEKAKPGPKKKGKKGKGGKTEDEKTEDEKKDEPLSPTTPNDYTSPVVPEAEASTSEPAAPPPPAEVQPSADPWEAPAAESREIVPPATESAAPNTPADTIPPGGSGDTWGLDGDDAAGSSMFDAPASGTANDYWASGDKQTDVPVETGTTARLSGLFGGSNTSRGINPEPTSTSASNRNSGLFSGGSNKDVKPESANTENRSSSFGFGGGGWGGIGNIASKAVNTWGLGGGSTGSSGGGGGGGGGSAWGPTKKPSIPNWGGFSNTLSNTLTADSNTNENIGLSSGAGAGVFDNLLGDTPTTEEPPKPETIAEETSVPADTDAPPTDTPAVAEEAAPAETPAADVPGENVEEKSEPNAEAEAEAAAKEEEKRNAEEEAAKAKEEAEKEKEITTKGKGKKKKGKK